MRASCTRWLLAAAMLAVCVAPPTASAYIVTDYPSPPGVGAMRSPAAGGDGRMYYGSDAVGLTFGQEGARFGRLFRIEPGTIATPGKSTVVEIRAPGGPTAALTPISGGRIVFEYGNPLAAETHGVAVLEPRSGSVRTVRHPGYALGFTQAPDGGVWFFASRDSAPGPLVRLGVRLQRLDPDAMQITDEIVLPSQLETSWKPVATADGALWFFAQDLPPPGAMVVGSRNGPQTLYRLDLATRALRAIAVRPGSEVYPGSAVGGLRAADGRLYFNLHGGGTFGVPGSPPGAPGVPGALAQVDPRAPAMRVLPRPGGLTLRTQAPGAMTIGGDGAIWYTAGSAIGRFEPGSGRFEEFLLPTGTGEPSGIATGPDGDVWFGRLDGGFGRIALTGSGVAASVSKALSDGFRELVSCAAACDARLALAVAPGGPGGVRAASSAAATGRVLARARVRQSGPGSAFAKLNFSAAGKRVLRGRREVRLRLTKRITTNGRTRTTQTRVVLRALRPRLVRAAR